MMYQNGSGERLSGGMADEAKLTDSNHSYSDTPESINPSDETRQGDTKLTLVHFKKDDGSGRYEGRFLRHKENGEGRHRLEEDELTFDEVMAQYDTEINRLKLELDEIIKQKEQAIADISPKSEPEQWVEDDWARIQAKQEKEGQEDKKPAIEEDNTDTDRIPVVSQPSPEDDKKPAVDEDKADTDGIRVTSEWPAGSNSVFSTILPKPVTPQSDPQTNLKGRENLAPGFGEQATEVVEQPKPAPVRSNIDSRSKIEHKQVKKRTWQERLGRNKNRVAAVIGGVALSAVLVAGAAILTSSLRDNDKPESGSRPPAASTETVPDFAADGIVTRAEMQNRWVSQVYDGEDLPYRDMLENAGSAMSSGDATVVYQWDGTYFYKVTPKAMNSFGLHGDPTSTQNVMEVLAAHSDGEIKIAS